MGGGGYLELWLNPNLAPESRESISGPIFIHFCMDRYRCFIFNAQSTTEVTSEDEINVPIALSAFRDTFIVGPYTIISGRNFRTDLPVISSNCTTTDRLLPLLFLSVMLPVSGLFNLL